MTQAWIREMERVVGFVLNDAERVAVDFALRLLEQNPALQDALRKERILALNAGPGSTAQAQNPRVAAG